jgi:hypothetical protein
MPAVLSRRHENNDSARRPDDIHFVEPMLALVVEKIPEARSDSRRSNSRVPIAGGGNGSAVMICSRRGKDFTDDFPEIARAVCENRAVDRSFANIRGEVEIDSSRCDRRKKTNP